MVRCVRQALGPADSLGGRKTLVERLHACKGSGFESQLHRCEIHRRLEIDRSLAGLPEGGSSPRADPRRSRLVRSRSLRRGAPPGHQTFLGAGTTRTLNAANQPSTSIVCFIALHHPVRRRFFSLAQGCSLTTGGPSTSTKVEPNLRERPPCSVPWEAGTRSPLCSHYYGATGY